MPQFIQVSAPFFPITKWILKEKYFEISYSTAVHRFPICPRSHVCMCKKNKYIYIRAYVCICVRKNNIYNPTYYKHVHKLICDSHLTTVPWFVTTSQPPSSPSISPGPCQQWSSFPRLRVFDLDMIHAIWIPRFLGRLTRMTTYIS